MMDKDYILRLLQCIDTKCDPSEDGRRIEIIKDFIEQQEKEIIKLTDDNGQQHIEIMLLTRKNKQQEDNKAILLQVFTERELYDLQLKYYAEVCRQPKHYFTMNNIILDKLGGLPKVKEREYDDYQK